MLEFFGDIWSFRKPEDWVCITTCGVVKQNGDLVMGSGIALQAAQRYPWLPAYLGLDVNQNGARVKVDVANKLIAFPTKYHFKDKSDINLILRSTLQLLEAAQHIEGRILLPRPGCSNGRLDWLEVEPMLRHYLTEDRFIIFSLPKEQRQ